MLLPFCTPGPKMKLYAVANGYWFYAMLELLRLQWKPYVFILHSSIKSNSPIASSSRKCHPALWNNKCLSISGAFTG